MGKDRDSDRRKTKSDRQTDRLAINSRTGVVGREREREREKERERERARDRDIEERDRP